MHNVIAMTDDFLLREHASVCEKIGQAKLSGFIPKQLDRFRVQYENEILRRLSRCDNVNEKEI